VNKQEFSASSWRSNQGSFTVLLDKTVFCILQVDHDHCSPNPCENEAPCFNTQADYYCHCPEDWEGKNCSMPRLQCSSPPCEGTVTWYFTFWQSTGMLHKYRRTWETMS